MILHFRVKLNISDFTGEWISWGCFGECMHIAQPFLCYSHRQRHCNGISVSAYRSILTKSSNFFSFLLISLLLCKHSLWCWFSISVLLFAIIISPAISPCKYNNLFLLYVHKVYVDSRTILFIIRYAVNVIEFKSCIIFPFEKSFLYQPRETKVPR